MNSFLGIAIILLVAYAFSSHRKHIRWRTVGGAFAFQVALGAFVLYVPFGQDVLFAVASGRSEGHCIHQCWYSIYVWRLSVG